MVPHKLVHLLVAVLSGLNDQECIILEVQKNFIENKTVMFIEKKVPAIDVLQKEADKVLVSDFGKILHIVNN